MFSFRHVLLKFLMPVSKFIGKIHSPWSRKKIRAKQVEQVLKLAEPGDILLSRTMGELTNFAIQGYFKHAAMYVFDKTVCESISPETSLTNLYDFLMSKDAFCLLRPSWLKQEERLKAAQIMTSLCGKPYDYMFDIGEQAFYCAESCWFSLSKACDTDEDIFKRRTTMGVQTVLPQDFFDAKSKFELVAAFPWAEMPSR